MSFEFLINRRNYLFNVILFGVTFSKLLLYQV